MPPSSPSRAERSPAAGDLSWWQAPAPPIDPDRILRVHRYPDPARVRPVIRAAAERAVRAVEAIATPRAAYARRATVARDTGRITLSGGITLRCPAFDRLLADCPEVVVFVLTLGPRIDTAVADLLARSEPVDALFLESVAWLTVERATRQLGADLRRTLAPQGLRLGFRLGPGYDYKVGAERERWPLEEQHLLFQALGEADLPVTLLDSAAMMPKMSRSGLFGIAPAAAEGSQPL